MPHRIRQAIVARWDSEGLTTSVFPGDVWVDEAPEDTAFPYCVLTGESEVPLAWSSGSKYRDVVVTFNVFVKETDASDPLNEVGTLFDALEDSYDEFLPVIVPASEGSIITARTGGRDIILLEERIWQGTLDYMLLLRTPKPACA